MMNVMKPKRLVLGVMAVGMACALPTLAQAGPMNKICSDCHTMHNSQSGGTMSDQPYTSANAQLLRVDCVGCHIDGTSTNDGTTVIPQVGGAGAQGANMLAGGYFSSLVGDRAKTHSVAGYSAVDTSFDLATNDPPGWEGVAGAWVGDGTVNEQLTCSGSGSSGNAYTVGCHRGGGHHANNTRGTGADGSTVGKSFRFLSGVKGLENAEWEHSSVLASDDHNEYYAILRAQGGADQAQLYTTINGLCARCHGNFHGNADQDSSGEWIRHPTDVDLTASASEHSSYATYDPLVPVGMDDDPPTIVNGTVQTAGNGIVLCISCHRAHGSPYDDLLRWNYSGMVAGSTAVPGTGCFKCHRDKD